ncbi:MAG: hypothetical protein NTY38_16440, partial [Acidobacteria bacterium]|nr:hypothetical protein [Acidobacteriota bacterium]
MRIPVAVAAALCLAVCQAPAQTWLLRGRVVMEDGSLPPGTVAIERICEGMDPVHETVTGREGRFQLRLADPASEGATTALDPRTTRLSGTHCYLHA